MTMRSSKPIYKVTTGLKLDLLSYLAYITRFCAVTFGRIRRYQSGFYATKSMETREHTAVNATLSPIHKEVKKGSGPHIMPIKTRRNPETSFSFTPNPSPR